MRVQHWPDKAPDKSKPYCLVDSSGTILGWYATLDDAENQMDSMRQRKHSFLAPVRRFSDFGGWLDNNTRWVQLYPYGSWDHPVYSKTVIDRSVAEKLKESFDNKIYNDKLFTNYEHGLSKAHGTKASGEYKALEVRDDGLWGLVQFTDTARKEIDDGEWNYWSTEHYDLWENPQTNQRFNYVLSGGALTNSPYVGGMAPLNFSEVAAELHEQMIEPKQFAVWSTAYVNTLPDSAFLYIQSGGKKDSEGKTVPRTLRHFPYKDKNGNVDLPHLRNAIARIPQAGSWLSDQLKSTLQAKARKLLGAKNYSDVLTIEAEFAPEWFQEPGSGIIDYTINEDDSYPNRRDTPPPGQDGSVPDRADTVTNDLLEGGNTDMADELEQQLRTALGIAEDVDLVQHVQGLNSSVASLEAEVAPLRELEKQHSQAKLFSKEYPAEFERLQRLEEESKNNLVKQFSDRIAEQRVTRKEGNGDDAKDVKTTIGLSARAIDEIGSIVKKFSNSEATLDDFKGVMDAIFDNGIVDYGDHGSTREDTTDSDDVPNNIIDARKAFSVKVSEIMEADQLDVRAATVEAAKKYPNLFEAWKQTPVSA